MGVDVGVGSAGGSGRGWRIQGGNNGSSMGNDGRNYKIKNYLIEKSAIKIRLLNL